MTARRSLDLARAAALTFAASVSHASAQVAAPVTPIDRFKIEADMRVLYDDNIFRDSGDTRSRVADIVYDPRVTATVNQQFGHDLITARGVLGYTLYQSHSSRDRTLAAIDGDGRFGIGSHCVATPSAGYRMQQLDYDDVIVRRTNTRRTTDYAATIACPRVVGLYPTVSFTGRTVRNSTLFSYSDRDNREVAAGIGYRRPSLGELTLYAARLQSARPGDTLTVRATSVGGRLVRAVSHRTQIDADVHWLSVSSAGPNDFRGIAWTVRGTLLPSPRFTIAVDTQRAVNTSSLIASRYAIESTVGVEVDWRFSGRSSVSLIGRRSSRRFRGLIAAAPIIPRQRDRTWDAQAQYRYRLNTHFTLALGAERFKREVDVPTLGYSVNRVLLSAETNF